MADQRYIRTKTWDDKYIRKLDPHGKLLFIYLFTNSLATISGAYEIEIDRIKFDTGLSKAKIDALFDKFREDEKVYYEDGWVLTINTIKAQTLTNAKIRIGIEESLKCCPQWIKDRVSIAYDWLSHLNKSYSIPSNGKPIGDVPSPRRIPEDAPADEVDGWLNVIAPLTGAKDRKSIVPEKRWRGTVATAIREGRNLPDFAEVVKGEYARPPNELRFVTPEKCLQLLQQQKLKRGEKLQTLEEKLQDDAANRAAIKGPQTKITTIEGTQ